MPVLNRVQQTVSGTPGTGQVTLSTALIGFDSFAGAGAVDGGVYSYLILEGNSKWEYGRGTYVATGTKLTRSTIIKSSAGVATAESFSSAALVVCDAIAEDFAQATAAEVRAGTDLYKLISAKAWADAAAPVTLTDAAGTVTWDLSAGFNANWTIGGTGRTLALTNPKVGWTYALGMFHNAANTAPSLPSSIKWGNSGIPTPSTASGKKDFIFLYCYDAATPEFRGTFSKDS